MFVLLFYKMTIFYLEQAGELVLEQTGEAFLEQAGELFLDNDCCLSLAALKLACLLNSLLKLLAL